ncbi:hypothetical protein P7B02_12835 [Caulobacter segnis]|uniref:hypothetical protein n=1 Tax=Caulobacter segnis TaxID=88688 RepID=UPI00240EA1D0|nr:hypothetical protein [Caulobacter segnis]MDG2522431.1 hypothetical protein [Caulobacter segnis]
MKTKLALIAAAGLAAVTLAGCEKPIEAPYDTGVCWHVAAQKDGTMKFNVLAKNQPNVENCAASLEGMRIRFNRMGMNQQQLIGAYQGNFLFVQREGIFVGKTLTGGRYLALVRTGDGRLAVPGAMPQ